MTTKPRELQRVVETVSTLALGSFLLPDKRFAARAAKRLRVLFIDRETPMRPQLAHAIPSMRDEPHIGIPEITILAREFVDSITLLGQTPAPPHDNETAARLRRWFAEHLLWLRARWQPARGVP